MKERKGSWKVRGQRLDRFICAQAVSPASFPNPEWGSGRREGRLAGLSSGGWEAAAAGRLLCLEGGLEVGGTG